MDSGHDRERDGDAERESNYILSFIKEINGTKVKEFISQHSCGLDVYKKLADHTS